MRSSNIKGITIQIGADTSKFEKAMGTLSKEGRSLQNELKGVDRLLKLDPSNVELLTQKQKLLAQSVDKTKEKLNILKQTQSQLKSQGIDEASEEYRDLQREISYTTQKLDGLEKEQKEFNKTSVNMKASIANMEKYGQKAEAAGKKMMRVTAGVGLLGAGAVKTGAEFDKSMSRVQATSGASGKELEALEKKAREMGSKTAFSASDAADGLNYMAMAGWKTDQMISGLPGIMYLAGAAGEDLATTSDIVTDALTAMGYEAKDSGKLADVMAAASSNANTNVSMMGQTFKYAASVAGTLGYSMEDVALATGLMANSGIKADQAGTSLRQVFSRLASPTDKIAGQLERLGVEVTNADGSMKPFREVLLNLRTAFSGLSQEEQAQAAKTIAGTDAMSGFLALMNGSDADFNKLASAIDNSSGAAERMYGVTQNNLAGSLATIKSQFEEIALEISELVTPVFAKIANVVSRLAQGFINLPQPVKGFIVAAAAAVAAIGPALLAFAGMVRTIKFVRTALSGLTIAFNPWMLVIAAAIAAGLLIIKNWDKIKKKAQELAKMVGAKFAEMKTKLSTAMQSIRERVKGAADNVKARLDSMKEKFASAGETIKSRVTGAFQRVRDAIVNPISSAREKISGILDKIKGFFPIKLGHIFSGLSLPKFDVYFTPIGGIKGKALKALGIDGMPHLDVKWNAEGGIFDSAQIFGYGIGEKGAEAIIPLDKFWKKLDAMQAGGNTTINFNGSYSFRNKSDIDYFMKEAGTLINRRVNR